MSNPPHPRTFNDNALYRTTAGMAFPTRPDATSGQSHFESREWAKQARNRRVQTFSKQFFSMYEDTSLNSLERKTQRHDEHKIYMAQKAAERETRVLELELLEEEKRERRQALREERRRMAQVEHAAACVIQRMARCHEARRVCLNRRLQIMHDHAAVVQRFWRRCDQIKRARAECRRRVEHHKMVAASTAIQGTFTKYAARREARAVLEGKRRDRAQRRARLVEQHHSRSATRVQASFRGWRGRQRARDYANKRKQHMLLVRQEERLRQKVDEQLRKKETERKGSGKGGRSGSKGAAGSKGGDKGGDRDSGTSSPKRRSSLERKNTGGAKRRPDLA